ncbi:hypothetical protein RvY_00696 [Ramazzottius varieornatus]|uniref:Uncharacterized protein n=1 Tax=Ramazzottius varieornatus TaxID=947166 RepID=A0A1D1UHB3_RAMVA|nr:hypothetical protein RvY_00696 [Ramazzottius varieornatus]
MSERGLFHEKLNGNCIKKKTFHSATTFDICAKSLK